MFYGPEQLFSSNFTDLLCFAFICYTLYSNNLVSSKKIKLNFFRGIIESRQRIQLLFNVSNDFEIFCFKNMLVKF